MTVFVPLVVVLIGQFCRDVIDRQNLRVAVIGRFSVVLLFRSAHCLLRSVGFACMSRL